MTDEFPGLSSFVDRHGTRRWRYRAKGRTVSLPHPDHPGFREAYNAAVERRERRSAEVAHMPGATLPRSFTAAWRQLQRSVRWLDLDDATRAKNQRLIEEFLRLRIVADDPLTFGQVEVAALKRRHVEELLGRYLTTPHKAKHLLTAIRKLIRVGIREEWRGDDPTHLVEWRPAYAGWKAWPAEAMAAFEAHHKPGSAARTCYGLALWLGNRRGDVAQLRWDQMTERRIVIDGRERRVKGFQFVQQKNAKRTGGKELFVPLTPMLDEILQAAPRTAATVLATAYGKPFSQKSLTGMMAHWTRQAGLRGGLTLHGLRKSLGVHLAESEASTRQLMEVLGHDDIEHAELYSREASQVRLAVQGMDRVVKLVRSAKRGG